MLPPRWDKAPYLPNRAKGAASFAVTTALPYSKKAGAPEEAVAEHIEKAFYREIISDITRVVAERRARITTAQQSLPRLGRRVGSANCGLGMGIRCGTRGRLVRSAGFGPELRRERRPRSRLGGRP